MLASSVVQPEQLHLVGLPHNEVAHRNEMGGVVVNKIVQTGVKIGVAGLVGVGAGSVAGKSADADRTEAVRPERDVALAGRDDQRQAAVGGIHCPGNLIWSKGN